MFYICSNGEKMAFLTEEELGSLKIEQSVFHIVGPKEVHFQLLEAFDATPHAAFFLDRIRSVNNGNHYTFLADAAARTQLGRIDKDAAQFQAESENLAEAFNEGHGGSTVIGAFLIFSLNCDTGRVFALLKFEDEKVLRYDIEDGTSGKPKPTLAEIGRTFVQNRHALQKAALVRLDGEGSVCLVDRQNPQRPAVYFEQFLGVKRVRNDDDLTRILVDVTKAVAYNHSDKLPADVMTSLTKRLYDATQSGGSVDGEKIEDWFTSIVGPLPKESEILTDFRKQLERARISGESFVLGKDAIPVPRNRKVETGLGVRVTFPAELQSSVVNIDEKKGLITIQDEIKFNDIELDASRRARR